MKITGRASYFGALLSSNLARMWEAIPANVKEPDKTVFKDQPSRMKERDLKIHSQPRV